MTHDHTCPHCKTHMKVEGSDNDTLNLAGRFLHMVHCEPCTGLKKAASRTERAINALHDALRTATDAQQINALQGSLKAQYTSRTRIAEKLETRLRINQPDREQNAVANTGKGSLPW